MQPLGLLGALLGGYQQGRLSSQSRQLRAAQLLRQQQENAATAEYRKQSLEMQRRRLAAMEDPAEKSIRELFLNNLSDIGKDVDNSFEGLAKTALTPEDYRAGATSIYNRNRDRYAQLRAQHAASPHLQKLGDFDTISGYSVPDFIKSDKFDDTRYKLRRFDPRKFQADALSYLEKQVIGNGITDPFEQEAAMNTFMQSQAAMSGQNPEYLWSISGVPRPNQVERGFTVGTKTTGPVATNLTDPSLPAFGRRTQIEPGGTVTYQHGIPEQAKTLPDFQRYLQSRNGVAPQVPNAHAIVSDELLKSPINGQQMADEWIIDDLHQMFTLPELRQKYNLTDASDPMQFRRAMEIYMSQDGHQDVSLAIDRAYNYGAGTTGLNPLNYQYADQSNFAQSPKGLGIQSLYQQAPLTATTTTLAPVPYERRSSIPLSLDAQQKMASIKRTEAAVQGQSFTNDILQAKANVARANQWNDIRQSDLKTLTMGMRLALEPLKYELAKQRFDLDAWDKQTDNDIQAGRFSLDQMKARLNEASGPIKALLNNAQRDLTSAGIMLNSAFNQNLLSSAVFKSNPSLASKIISKQPLTEEEIKLISTDVGLMSNKNVSDAVTRYTNAQATYKTAYAGVLSYANLASTFSKSNFYGTGRSYDPGEDPLADLEPSGGTAGAGNAGGSGTASGGSTAGSGATNSGGGTARPSKTTPAPSASTPKPSTPAPSVSSSKPTSSAAIADAQKRFKAKSAKPKPAAASPKSGSGKNSGKNSTNPLDDL